MPLTPEDVSNKRFTTVRLREGYDMTEVDQFLDEVEAALATLTRENDELRSKLQTAQGGAPLEEAPAVAEAETPETEQVSEEAPEPTPEEEQVHPALVETPSDLTAGPPAEAEAPAEAPAEAEVSSEVPAEASVETPAETPAPATTATPALETFTVTTTAEASAAATRLLELAGRNADELVLEAREEAEKIVGEARVTAETLETEARQRAEALDTETTQRRESVFGDIERERAELDTEIANLRTFEREYRAQLKSYFEQQLEALDGHGEGGSLAEPLGHREPEQHDDPSTSPGEGQDGEVSRLQALLAEDEEQHPHDGDHQG
jgi:DivIVA domain-containing protein